MHPTLGALRQVVTPVFSATDAAEPAPGVSQRPPPLLGEHTLEVLREAGFNTASINALLAAKAVYQDTSDSPAMASAQSTGTAQ